MTTRGQKKISPEEFEEKATEFISIASHQLRTPLGSMRWNLEMLLANEYGMVPPKIKRIIKQIYQSDLRMINLVNNLLSVSRIDHGRVSNEPRLTDIALLIKSAAAEIQTEAQKRSLTGKLIFGKEPIASILIDAKRLHEVIHNLLTNAIKYNKVKGSIIVDVRKIDHTLRISVSDTGMGIPPQDLKRIFSKYFRASNASRATSNGSGLGLFIVKSYVEGWGGKIKIQSELGKGTTVTITLPLQNEKNSHH